uniref:Uncharacterized protein n=1 Tax=Brassica campestris TaxID=3711 RepID=A0A3P6B498_BRACM|nr:unnamed protein product [Brassica rapa]
MSSCSLSLSSAKLAMKMLLKSGFLNSDITLLVFQSSLLEQSLIFEMISSTLLSTLELCLYLLLRVKN